MAAKTAIIIGAGPAGLTAAYELVTRTDIVPLVVEANDHAGGIARTIDYKGNRIDLGGHRFFSKSQRVMDWWTRLLPVQGAPCVENRPIGKMPGGADPLLAPGGPDPESCDDVMLVRRRVSRILFGGRFYDYPLKPSFDTFAKLGVAKTCRIAASYTRAQLLPVRPEDSLADFLTNRFGHELYSTFFRDYTEKVWGVPCDEIPAEWGAQRIKGVSVSALLKHALARAGRRGGGVRQKGTETSLIEQFLYPKFGPGQLWTKVAASVGAAGGEILWGTRVVGLNHRHGTVDCVQVQDSTGASRRLGGDLFFSSMPLRDLVAGLSPSAPCSVQEVAHGLPYRDFVTVGLLLDRLGLEGGVTGVELGIRVPDNWIYVQEPHVKVGRLQIFNNWSPYMVADRAKVWLGLEYFANATDALWRLPDTQLSRLAVQELADIGFARSEDVLDSVVIRMPKAYPAYFGSYGRIREVRGYLGTLRNLYLLGRNGLHRYNNQDHSMLTALEAVDAIVAGTDAREALWDINAEQDYHEARQHDG